MNSYNDNGLLYDKSLLILYDLITGRFFEIEMENRIQLICADDKQMYVVASTFFEYNKFSFSILRKSIDDQVLKVYKTNSFSLSNVDKSMYTVFSICDDDKLYVFYTFINSGYHYYENLVDYLNDKHLVIICIETMTVISNQKLTDCIKYGTGRTIYKKVEFQDAILKKLFFLKKTHKCFINVFSENLGDIVLVFDTKDQYFSFAEDMFTHIENKDITNVKYTVGKDDLIYMYRCYGTNSSGTKEKQEIRTFQYHNDKLVDVGIKWKENRSYFHKEVQSICIV